MSTSHNPVILILQLCGGVWMKANPVIRNLDVAVLAFPVIRLRKCVPDALIPTSSAPVTSPVVRVFVASCAHNTWNASLLL